MPKTILITGGTDGIGKETAKRLTAKGHHVLIHGRNPDKLKTVVGELAAIHGGGKVLPFQADLADLQQVGALADAVKNHVAPINVLINNAGVYKTAEPTTNDGLDRRFVVNTLAPYVLAQRLSATMASDGRIINLASAAQAAVDLAALRGERHCTDGEAYAQSKLAMIMWSFWLAQTSQDGPVILAVNPGSLLGSKMVRDAFGIAGGDLGIGADILVRAAFDRAFSEQSGRYFDNDSNQIAPPHPDALDAGKNQRLVETMEAVIASLNVSLT